MSSVRPLLIAALLAINLAGCAGKSLKEGRDLIAVALGAPTNATRFADVVRMVQKTTTPPRTNS